MNNINKRTSIKVYSFTYNPLILQHVSIFLSHPPGVIHQTNTYEFFRRLKFWCLKIVDIIKLVDVQNLSVM